MSIKVGVLSLQGAFKEHIDRIKGCGASAVEVRFPQQMDDIDGIIIPGGESTTINKLLEKYKLKEKLNKFYKDGKPIFGTCAGLILISRYIKGEGRGLGYIDINVQRNAYGRQIDSFEQLISIDLDGIKNGRKFNSIFIRAPRILNIGKEVKLLGKSGKDMVLVRDGNVMASTFHPELTDDLRIHRYFLDIIKNNKEES